MIEMRDVREKVVEIVSSLYQVELRMLALAELVPLPADAEQMCESEIPMTALVNLHGVLNAVRSDYIEEAIASLACASRQDDVSLREEFQRRRGEMAAERASQAVAGAKDSGITWSGGVSFPKSQDPGEVAGRKEPPPCSD